MLTNGRHHSLTVIQVLEQQSQILFPSLVTSNQEPRRLHPSSVCLTCSFFSLPSTLTFLVCLISHVDGSTDLHTCVASPSQFLSCLLALWTILFISTLGTRQLPMMFKGKLLAYVDHFEWLYLEFSFEAYWFWCLWVTYNRFCQKVHFQAVLPSLIKQITTSNVNYYCCFLLGSRAQCWKVRTWESY